MLTTLFVWLIVALAAWGYGSRCLSDAHTRATSATEAGVKFYCGLLVLCTAMLAVALARGISWWIGPALLTPGVVLGIQNLSWSSVRRFLKLPLGALAVLALFVSTRPVDFYDTGLYHQQAVKWLSDFGVVPGVALLNYRLGWNSSWFAGAAALNHGVLAGREAPMVGGMLFALLIVAGLGTLATMRAADGLRSRTWLIFGGVLALAMMLWNVESSLSADPVIWMLPLMLSLTASDEGLGEAAGAGSALLIAALACAVRLTCLPLLAYTGVLWVWSFVRTGRSRGGAGRRRLAVYAASACVPLLVVGAANFRAAGCPLFPSPVACSTGESSVGAAFAVAVSADISATTAESNRHFPEYVAVALTGSVAALMLAWRSLFVRHCIGTSWSGIFFLTVTGARNPRFGLGYFCLPVAAAGAALLGRTWLRGNARAGSRAIPALVACGAVVAVWVSWHDISRKDGLVLPTRMAGSEGDPVHHVSRHTDEWTQLRLAQARRGDVSFLQPLSSDQCWDAALPCTRETTVDLLRLRDPKGGIGAGFQSEAVRRLVR